MKRSHVLAIGATLAVVLIVRASEHAAPAAAQTAPAVIRMTDADQFAPKSVTVKVGTTIRWDNVSTMIHTVTDSPALAAYPKDALLPKGAAPFNSGFVKPGASFERTFTVPGIYHYFCMPHEALGMTASIVVEPANGPVSAAAVPVQPPAQTLPRQPLDAKLFPTPVYVALQRSNEIEVFPQQSLWKGFEQAHYDAISADRSRLVVSGFQNGNVSIANASDGHILATLHAGGLIQGVKVDPNGEYALAVDAKDGVVAAIDMRALKLVSRIPVGKTPHNVVYGQDGRIAYVTLQGQDAVAIVDMRSLKKIGEIELPGMNGPHNLDVSADGRSLWVRSHATPDTAGEVTRIDLASRRAGRYTKVGDYHGGMAVRPSTGYAFTTDIGGDTADALNVHTGALVKRIVVGSGPHGIRLSPNGRYAYVTVTRANRLVVIDTRTLRVLESIRTRGNDPFWLAVAGND